MAAQKPLSILISGAGVAGTTLALTLARLPALNPKPLITLLERSPTPRTTGQAIDIRGPAVKLIRKLGIEEKIRAKHTTEVGISMLGRDGKEVAKFEMTGDPDRQSFTTSEYEVLRGELVDLIMEEIAAAGREEGDGVQVKTVYGEYVKEMREDEDGVEVAFMNGMETTKYDVVVATDGASSRTRGLIFPEYKSLDCMKPQGMYIAYYSVPRLAHDSQYWRWYHSPGGLTIHMRPHRTQKTMGIYLSMTLPKKERSPEIDAVIKKDVDAQKDFLRERFRNVGWEAERLLDEMDKSQDFYFQQVSVVVTPKWTQGRCAITGDSAFAAMGIGTSHAMIGAYMIAGELSKVKSNDGKEIAAALQRYEDGLRPLAGKDSEPPPMFPQMMNPQSGWGIGVLHGITKAMAVTKFDKLLMKVLELGEPKEEKWKLPEYGLEKDAGVQSK